MDLLPLLSLCLADRPGMSPDAWWSAWSLAPQTVLPLAAALFLYAGGLARARAAGAASLPAWRVACFVAGWLTLVAALVSPLCRLAATLVSAHMVQHMLLVAVAPPLLALGAPLRVLAEGWSLRVESAKAPALPLVLPATFYGLAIWLWHFPPLYTLVLLDAAAHTLAYLVLIGVSVLFWSRIVQAAAAAEGMSTMAALFTTMLHTGVLGALLTFSPRTWYPVLAGGAPAWGFTPLEDQQLAGLIMWVPMSSVYLIAALAIIAAYLARPHEDSAALAAR